MTSTSHGKRTLRPFDHSLGLDRRDLPIGWVIGDDPPPTHPDAPVRIGGNKSSSPHLSFLDGEMLKHRIERAPLKTDSLADLAVQIAEGLTRRTAKRPPS
jgi:hypothetical protein